MDIQRKPRNSSALRLARGARLNIWLCLASWSYRTSYSTLSRPPTGPHLLLSLHFLRLAPFHVLAKCNPWILLGLDSTRGHHFYYCYEWETGAASTTRNGPIPKTLLPINCTISSGARRELMRTISSVTHLLTYISHLQVLVSCLRTLKVAQCFPRSRITQNNLFFIVFRT